MSTARESSTCRPRAPRRGLILGAGCFSMAVFAMACVNLAAVLEPISREFDRSVAECSVLLIYAPAGFILSTLLGGHLSDRWGQRVFILTGFCTLATGTILAACAGSYWLLCAGLFLVGVSGGFIESPVSAVVANAFPERRAQALNFTQVFFNVGAVTGPAVAGGILWMGFGWRYGFGFLAVMAAIAFVVSYFGLPAAKRRSTPHARAGKDGKIRWGIVLTMAAAMFLYVGGELTVAQWCAKYANETFAMSVSASALTVSGFWLGMMAGRALYTALVGRIGHLVLVMFSAVLGGGAAVGAAMTPSGAVAALACGLVGFFLGGSWPTMLGYTAHKSPGRTGTVFGVLVAAGAGGSLVTPALAGWVAVWAGRGLRTAMWVGAGAILLEGLVIFGVWLWDRSPRRDNGVRREP